MSEGPLVVVAGGVAEELSGDLELVDAELTQVAERRLARSEVIDG